MMETKAMVVRLLKSYTYKKRQIDQLRFELMNPPSIHSDEFIGSLALKTPKHGMAIHRGVISDKTMTIALQYEDMLSTIKTESVKDIMQELHILEAEVSRLEHYVSLLSEKDASAILMLYFEQKSWLDVEAEMRISHRTLVNYRNRAIKELVSMYEFLCRVTQTPQDNTS